MYKREDCCKYSDECSGDVMVWDAGIVLSEPLCEKHATDAMQKDSRYFSKLSNYMYSHPDEYPLAST